MFLCFIRLKCILLLLYFDISTSSGQATTDLACNGSVLAVDGTFGTISSPNYPGSYPDRTTCRWAITTPVGTRIAIKFEEVFAIEPLFLTFCYDTLFFVEPGNSLQICGFTTYNSFVSNGNALNVTFVTDVSVSFSGFSFNWSSVDPDAILAPVVNVTTTSGVISSPNYPNPYPPFSNYIWNILNGTAGKFKVLEFDSLFDLESFSNDVCPYDSLTIEDFDGVVTLQFCQEVSPLRQLMRSSDFRVTFKSDQSNEGAGFSFRFSEIDPPTCEAETTQTGNFGVVSTPIFPLAYGTGFDCTWFVIAPENTRVAVRFDPMFGIEESSGCSLSFLQIFDGPSTNSTQFQQNFCGQYAPRNFLTRSNSLTVRFVSASNSESAVGFSLNWTAEAKCDAEEFSCWDGTCINESLTCDGNVDCPMDIADEAICSQENQTQCGIPEVSPVFYWDARIIGGHEVQKGSWPWQGYTQVQGTSGAWHFICGATLIFDEWALTAAHCIVAKGLTTRVTFGEHSLSEEDPGIEQRSVVDAMYVPPEYRYTLQSPWIYGYDIALLHLVTPMNFTAYVKPVCLPTSPPVVGDMLVVTGWGTTSLQSSAATDILRQVRVPVVSQDRCNKGVTFEIPDNVFCAGTESGGSSTCEGDSGSPAVRLTNGTWQAVGISSFGVQCGLRGESPSAYANVYELLPLINSVISSYGPKEPTNFVIRDQTSGVITSPNYGSGPYPQDLYLRWYIMGPADTVIVVRFDSNFSVNPSQYGRSPCNGDFLLVYDGADTSAVKYGNKKLCGLAAPPDFESNSNSIIVEFQSDLSFESVGFKLTWTAVAACEVDQFRCWNTTCIPGAEKCNGISDCTDQEDEIQCARGEAGSEECGKSIVAPEIPWNPHIVGGHNSPEGAWPWQVALYAQSGEDWRFACGGTIIEKDLVLTAAHCISPSLRYQVSVGDYDLSTTSLHERRINVTFKIIHPDYSSINDIAVLILEESIDLTSRWTKPVCLPSRNDTEPLPNTTCMTVGWGVVGIYDTMDVPNILQQTQVRILNDTVCDAIFVGFEHIRRSVLCVGHEHERASTCFGDSGGGVFCLEEGSWFQYGIVSFGTVCGRRTYYERVSLHHDFLDSVRSFQECKGLEIREGTSGTVTPPILSGRYIPNIDCSWLLRGPTGTVLVIQFDFFDVEECLYTYYDYLNIYDGNSTSHRQILDERLCGRNLAVRGFESSHNEVLITFVSDVAVQGAGFRIMWMAVENCDSAYYRCWNGSCINADLKCDGNVDCLDKSDETECPRVGSEECGRQDIEPEFLWPARIVGGSFVKNGSWPFQVLLRTQYDYTCAGTIVSPMWILTSENCVSLESRPLFVVVGEIDASVEPKESKMYGVQETYTSTETGSDIALLKLNRSIQFSSFVQPACLAKQNETYNPKPGETCVLLGWGRTTNGGRLSPILRQTRVPIINQDTCDKVADSFYPEKMFCGGNGGVGACEGDYGGPVMCLRGSSWLQFGIITEDYSCGVPGTPDIYTKVSYFTEWIEKTINGTLPSSEPVSSTTKTDREVQTDAGVTQDMPTATGSGQQPTAQTDSGGGASQDMPTENPTTTSSGLKMAPNVFAILLVLFLNL